MWRIIDLKDYMYCHRLPYWKLVRDCQEPDTILMQQGAEKHDQWQSKERHRNYVGRSPLAQAKTTSIAITDSEWGFIGVIDAIIPEGENAVTVVEQKYSSTPRKIAARWDQTQIYVYSLFLERQGYLVKGCFINYPGNSIFLPWTTETASQAYNLIQKFLQDISGEDLPKPAKPTACKSCWYTRYCW
jgi:CRISPR-associated exonuclease Cas4